MDYITLFAIIGTASLAILTTISVVLRTKEYRLWWIPQIVGVILLVVAIYAGVIAQLYIK